MNPHRTALAALLCLSVAASAAAQAETISFAPESIGKTPPGFDILLTGGGPAPRWEVVSDATSASGRALAQLSADHTDNRFPLAVYRPFAAANVQLSVRFRTIAGQVDQAAGLVARLSDADNYYIVRANALEDNVRFYRVVKGRRQELGGANIKVSPGEWHTLGLRALGDRFTISFDGAERYSVTDRTFSNAGKTGLWTKADSITHFDSLTIEALP